MTRECFNLEAERAAQCAMLRDHSCIEDVASIIGPGDFSKAHAPIVLQIFEIWQAGNIPDLVTVTNALKERNQLESVGGPAYLASLLDTGAISSNARAYAELVRKCADDRRAIIEIQSALQRVNSNGNDPQEAIGEMMERLQALRDPQGTATVNYGLSGKVQDYISAIEGTFTTQQIYAELGITDAGQKATVRQTLKRLTGKQIQAHGGKSGIYRVIRGEVEAMDLQNAEGEELDLQLPLDLHNYVSILPGNEIIVTGDPDAGKTAFLLRTIRQNLDKWDCHYFNSEMGGYELRKRLNLFNDFPVDHPHFHAYERGVDFEDVIQPGKYTLNVIDYLEITDEFYLIAKRLSDIYKNLRESVAMIAIQKRSRNSDMPLGAQRALEKPRLAIALNAGNATTPNRATILKCKNRKTDHSMIGLSRSYKLVQGCEFISQSLVWN